MRDFYNRHQYLIIWLLGLIIIGSLAVVILQMNGYIPNAQPTLPSQPAAPINTTPAVPGIPSVTLTLQKGKGSSTLVVDWQNLPAGTTALGIFRRRTGATSTGELVATIQVSDEQLGGGNASIDLGNTDEDGYSFYTEALGGGSGNNGPGNEDDASSTSTSTVLWTSDPVIPTPPANPTSTNPGTGGGGQSQPTSTPTSTSPDNGNDQPPPGGGNNPDNGSSTTGASSTSGGGDGSGPTQSSFYTPQIQSLGGSTDYGTFSVEHVDQNIEINWQGLPTGVTSIIIARSEDQTGPWNQILQEQNPGANGSSSIQLDDGTLGDPYYYLLTANLGTSTVETFGPEYLPPTQ